MEAYVSWQDDPIITTVYTTGKPISDITFPAVTICGLGTISNSIGEDFQLFFIQDTITT